VPLGLPECVRLVPAGVVIWPCRPGS